MNYRYDLFTAKRIPLIEKIPTWQGEGCNAGKRMLLVRFKYCNYHCPFCDTWSKMTNGREEFFSIEDIKKDMINEKINNLMITGGEPTLDKERVVITSGVGSKGIPSNLDATLDMLTYVPFEYADIETNGYNIEDLLHRSIKIMGMQKNKYINISYSPKFFQDDDVDMHLKKCQYLSLYNEYSPVLKVVVADDRSTNFVRKLITDGIYDSNKVYLMPLGESNEAIQKTFPSVVALAEELKCNISGRMHLTHNFT